MKELEYDPTEVARYLTDAQRHRFFELEKTFGSPGWKMLAEWALIKAEEAKEVSFRADNWEKVCAARAAAHTFFEVSQWETLFVNEFISVAEDAKANLADREVADALNYE